MVQIEYNKSKDSGLFQEEKEKRKQKFKDCGFVIILLSDVQWANNHVLANFHFELLII
jgi:hypothetical protein